MIVATRNAFSVALLAMAMGGAAPVSVAVSVDGKKLEARGTGECKHAPMAAIYGVRSAMWRVEFDGDGKSAVQTIRLTMWHPLDGKVPDQLGLYLSTSKDTHRIETVKGAKQVGSGSISFQKTGQGGRFVIKGKTAEGRKIDATLTCQSISSLEAVGG